MSPATRAWGTAIIDVSVFNTGKLGGPVAVGPGLPTLSEW